MVYNKQKVNTWKFCLNEGVTYPLLVRSTNLQEWWTLKLSLRRHLLTMQVIKLRFPQAELTIFSIRDFGAPLSLYSIWLNLSGWTSVPRVHFMHFLSVSFLQCSVFLAAVATIADNFINILLLFFIHYKCNYVISL